MIITHTEYFAFPNTPEGRSYAEIAESGFRDAGYYAKTKTTTTSIVVEYSETLELRPTVLEVMREPDDEGVE